jgi:hypothetical protein
MDHSEMLTRYRKLTNDERVVLILQLSAALTVVARDAYFREEVQEPKLLIRVNEFQRRSLAMAFQLARDHSTTWTEEGAVKYSITGCREVGATRVLENIFAGDHPFESHSA